MWRIFERLDTTPGQEKAIRSELEALMKHAREAKGALRNSGEDWSRAMRAAEFDTDAARTGADAQEQALRGMRDAVMASLARIHEVLDPRQREILADLMESGPRMRGGPYRGWM